MNIAPIKCQAICFVRALLRCFYGLFYSIKGKRRRWVVYWTVIYDCLPLVKTIKMPHWILKWQGIFITTHKFIFRETFLDMPFDTSIPMFGPLLSHVSLMCENLEKKHDLFIYLAWKHHRNWMWSLCYSLFFLAFTSKQFM